MAVAPTGAIYKALKFDGVSSRTYGVYITGAAVYNAPERDVEMIAIPGRNGSFALDKGRFENIEVSYPAGIFADAELDFAEAVSDFRNFLCSRNGYVRLQDEYNPDEYRLAVYKSGLEVEPALLRAGEFEIVFECKPQRYLTSGETAVTVTSGDTLTNPTLFEASPLIEVEGYGNVQFNGYNIEIDDGLYGVIQIAPKFSGSIAWDGRSLYHYVDPAGKVNDSDIFTSIMTSKFRWSIIGNNLYALGAPKNLVVTDNNGTTVTDTSVSYRVIDRKNIEFTMRTTVQWAYNGEVTSKLRKIHFTSDITPASDSDPWTNLAVYTNNINFFGATQNSDGEILTVWDIPTAMGEDSHGSVRQWTEMTNKIASDNGITADSTKTYLGNPTYIDCEIGEAYKEVDDEYISLNAYIDLGSKLPTFSPGANEITFDNTVTDLKIAPRWWKI